MCNCYTAIMRQFLLPPFYTVNVTTTEEEHGSHYDTTSVTTTEEEDGIWRTPSANMKALRAVFASALTE